MSAIPKAKCNVMKQIGDKKKRRKSIETLILKTSPHRVRIPRHVSNKSYGFNLRGSLQVRGHSKQRGQYVRSVDFNGQAHQWGLKAGDRVLAVNGVLCEDENHEKVIELIKATEDTRDLELVVVSDPEMQETARTATSGLLKKKAKEVISENTGIPHFTVEMTESALGRTKMLQRKIFGSPAIKGGVKNMVGVAMVAGPVFTDEAPPLSEAEREALSTLPVTN